MALPVFFLCQIRQKIYCAARIMLGGQKLPVFEPQFRAGVNADDSE